MKYVFRHPFFRSPLFPYVFYLALITLGTMLAFWLVKIVSWWKLEMSP